MQSSFRGFLTAGFVLASAFAALPSYAGLVLATNTSDSSQDTVNTLPSPGTGNYGDSVTGSPFIDSYIIYVPPSSLDAITTSLTSFQNIGISNLDVRLLSFTPGPGVAIPLTTPPTGVVVDSNWTQMIDASGGTDVFENILIDPTAASGYYVLQIQGDALSGGGSYAGVVNLTPVPLPASAPLFVVGAGLLFWLQRRRSATRFFS